MATKPIIKKLDTLHAGEFFKILGQGSRVWVYIGNGQGFQFEDENICTLNKEDKYIILPYLRKQIERYQ